MLKSDHLESFRGWFTRPLTPAGLVGMVGTVLVWVFFFHTVGALLPRPSKVPALVRGIGELLTIGGVSEARALRRSLALVGAWGVLGVGVVGLRGVRVLQGWLRERAKREALHKSNPGGCRAGWGARLLYLGGFGVTVAVLKRIDVFWRDYEKAGLTIIAYSVGRLSLAVYVLILCFTVGALLLRLLFREFNRHQIGDGAYSILAFFGGATVYGLAVTGVGLLGYLKLPVALVLTAPVLFWAPPLVGEVVGALHQKVRAAFLRQDPLGLSLHWLLGWCALAAGGLLLVSKGLYPGAADGDTWEHYLHYYREVLRSGTLGPNEIWYHYYLSKGAGLFFLSGLLSDALAAQLVSWGFMVMTALIVGHLLRRALRSTAWALLGVVVFFAYVTADGSMGAFFKHHAVLTGYIAFLVWASLQLLQQPPPLRPVFLATAAAAAFYISFYQPVPAALIATFFGVMTGLVVLSRPTRFAARSFATLALATVLGVGGAFLLGYAVTGMLNDVPIRVFWRIADQGRFEQAFGISGPASFLYSKNFFPPYLDKSIGWLAHIFRTNFFHFLFPPVPAHHGDRVALVLIGLLVASAVIVKLLQRTNGEWIGSKGFVVGISLAFLLPAVVFGQFVQIESTARLYLFTGFFMTVVGIMFVETVLDVFAARRAKQWFSTVLLVMLGSIAVADALEGAAAQLGSGVTFSLGRRSTAQVLDAVSREVGEPAKLAFISEVRRRLGPDIRIMTFGNVTDPSYSFPGLGLISEPTYTLGPHYQDIMFGPPDRAASLLRELRINHFHIDLTNRLYSGLAFSRLFRADTLSRYFTLAFQQGDNYLLTWRRREDRRGMPARFIRILELKQTGVLFYPFDRDFFEGATAAVGRALAAPKYSADLIPVEHGLGAEVAEGVTGLLREGMLGRVGLEDNEIFLRGLMSVVATELSRAAPRLVLRAFERERVDAPRAGSGLTPITEVVTASSRGADGAPAAALAQASTAEMVRYVRSLMRERYGRAFGWDLARSFARLDERIPFGVIYRSRGDTFRILEGKIP